MTIPLSLNGIEAANRVLDALDASAFPGDQAAREWAMLVTQALIVICRDNHEQDKLALALATPMHNAVEKTADALLSLSLQADRYDAALAELRSGLADALRAANDAHERLDAANRLHSVKA